jgi:site-specific recombinase XerD
MSIRKKGERLIIDYYPHGRAGKRVRQPLPIGTSLEEARAIEKELRSSGKFFPLSNENDPINRLVEEYYKYIELHQAITTVSDKKLCFRVHLLPFFGNTRIRDITSSYINIYQHSRKKSGGGNRTINKELDYFSAFLLWAKEKLKIVSLQPLIIDKLRYRRPIPQVLTFEEAVTFIKAAEPLYRVFFLLLFSLGLRVTSARMLKWKDIDFQNKSIRILGKGGRQNILPLSEWAEMELLEMKIKSKSEWVFESPVKKGFPITDVRKAIIRAKKTAGISLRIYPHLLRHSLATHLVSQNINLRTIQEILGHKQISTTEFYTQVAVQDKREALDGMGFDKKCSQT